MAKVKLVDAGVPKPLQLSDLFAGDFVVGKMGDIYVICYNVDAPYNKTVVSLGHAGSTWNGELPGTDFRKLLAGEQFTVTV